MTAVFAKISPERRRRRQFQKSFVTPILDARTNWVSAVKLREQGFYMVWVLQSWAQNCLTCDAPRIGICDFEPFSETYFGEILVGTEKQAPITHSKHSAFRLYRFLFMRDENTKRSHAHKMRKTASRTDRQTENNIPFSRGIMKMYTSGTFRFIFVYHGLQTLTQHECTVE